MESQRKSGRLRRPIPKSTFTSYIYFRDGHYRKDHFCSAFQSLDEAHKNGDHIWVMNVNFLLEQCDSKRNKPKFCKKFIPGILIILIISYIQPAFSFYTLTLHLYMWQLMFLKCQPLSTFLIFFILINLAISFRIFLLFQQSIAFVMFQIKSKINSHLLSTNIIR